MIHLKRNVIEAYAPFFGVKPPLVPFRDAAFSTCTFPITVLQVSRDIIAHLRMRISQRCLSLPIPVIEVLARSRKGSEPGTFLAE